jgi:hypothetical protein
MNDIQPTCKSTDHLFVPILEVSLPLLRCIHCNAFAYHDTVKQLAKNRAYRSDLEVEPLRVLPAPYWRRVWLSVRRNLGFA